MVKTKKSLLINDDGIVISPELKTSDHDVKYTNGEPVFNKQPSESERKLRLVEGLNWYNRFFDKKAAKENFIQYLEHINVESKILKKIQTINEKEYNIPLCWLSRMSLRGLILLESEKEKINNHMNLLMNMKAQIINDTEVKESNRPNVQEIMKEKTREAGGELEGIFDLYIIDGCKSTFSTKVIDELTKRNVLHQHVSILYTHWENKKNQFELVVSEKDKELSNGYTNFTKTQLKNCVKYCDQVLSDLNSYVGLKKASRAPRTRKVVPVEKIVSNLKYMKSHKEGLLELTSISPVKLHGCSECYLYDTELRKLIYLVADAYTKELSVKGTTILGFDTTKSQVKTIRKPEVQLKEFMKLGKPSGRKYFEDIKTVGVTPKGRTSDRMLILKAW